MGEGLGGAKKSSKLSPIGGDGGGHNNMKKTYISPLMLEVNVEAEQMLAVSLKMGGSDQTVDTSAPGNQLGRENDRQWGNLW